MRRRTWLGAAPALLLAACQSEEAAAPVTGAGPDWPRGLAVVYVGAPDCRFCRQWQSGARGFWIASPERARVTFIERQVPALLTIGRPSAWPADVRWIIHAMRAQDIGVGSPVFALTEGDRLLTAWSGLDGWDDEILPTLRRRLAQT